MQINSKIIFSATLVASLSLVFPVSAAQAKLEGPETNRPTTTKEAISTNKDTAKEAAGNFCTRFSTEHTNLESKLAEKEQELNTRRQERAEKTIEKRETRDEKLDSVRDQGDTQREANFTKLLEKADTDAKKAAVEAYKKTIQDAITKRRTAVDAALKTFRDGVNAAAVTHKAAVDKAIETLKTATDAATTKAAADCAANVPPTTVRQTFMKSMEAARKAFQTARNSTSNPGKKVEELAKAKNASIKAAFDEFRTTAEKARATLKTAFGM